MDCSDQWPHRHRGWCLACLCGRYDPKIISGWMKIKMQSENTETDGEFDVDVIL